MREAPTQAKASAVHAQPMPNYRRIWIPGGTYFFTVALADRRLDLLTTHVADLRAAFLSVRGARPFGIDAIVVLPDHIHAIWTLPPGDADYATRWGSYQGDVLACVARERTRERLTRAQARARNLAAAILGACDRR